MPTPSKGYFNAAGKRIPGTTTIIGRFKDSGGLVHWSWQCGMDGKDYRDVRDNAASVGTLVHAMVDAAIHKSEQPSTEGFTPEQLIQAANGLQAFKDWYAGSSGSILDTEMRLVSERHQFGGTPDAIAVINGKLCIADWKSGGVYQDALIQVAAYGQLWMEAHPEQRIEGYHIVRFAKDTGDFVHRHYADLSEAWEQFLLFRRAYEIDKGLKKRAQ
jgi:hypothetical protein